MIDGQLRYEVAQNLVTYGRPILLDPPLARLALIGRYQYGYTHYGAAGSVVGVPLIWLGSLTPDPGGEARRFLFSFTSCFFGALTAALLYLFYVELGVSRSSALAWTVVSSFATLLWPASTSSFDNAQHAFLLLLAVFLGYRSAIHRSNRLAAWAGVAAGFLIPYQEYFVILLPALAISTLARPIGPGKVSLQDRDLGAEMPRPWLCLPPREAARMLLTELRSLLGPAQEAAEGRTRYMLFVGSAGLGLALALGYNLLRFGSIFASGNLLIQSKVRFPLSGDPLVGLPTLLVSPGKSILLYSPPILLGMAGIRRLWRRDPYLGCAIVTTSLILLFFISNFAFAGGDWCWGPRYLVPLLPLWALAFPFVPSKPFRRRLVRAIVGAGLVVQLMGLAVDHQRYFLHGLFPDFFWADPWFYFKHSALLGRPGEIMSMKLGVGKTIRQFRPGPYPDSVTYCILGTFYRVRARVLMPRFEVFSLPRPWPLWMASINRGRRPVNIELWIPACLVIGMLGLAYIRFGFQMSDNSHVPQEVRSIVVQHPISGK